MYERILVAIDGSATSRRALDEAVKLARALDAALRILHVVDEVSVNWDSNYARPEERWMALEQAGDELLRASMSAVSGKGITCDGRLVPMDKLGRRVAEAIADEADAWHADLIVIGTHGRSGLHHALIGSIAEAVVRVATRPVLLVRAG